MDSTPAIPLQRPLVVSPHLDDGALGCGELIAAHPGALVVTVFAGKPRYPDPPTGWDSASGFGSGDDVVETRRAEDAAALAVLGARPKWLDFLDAQYAEPSPRAAIARALQRTIEEAAPTAVLIPFGLFHSDHELAHSAAIEVLKARQGGLWLAYEDAFYRSIPGLLQRRLGQLASSGVEATPTALDFNRFAPLKRRAAALYASQMRALRALVRGARDELAARERYWRLERRET